MARFLGVLLALALTVYALSDLAGSDERRRGGIPRAVWTILIVILPVIGPVAWLLVGRAVANQAPPVPPAPLAPDDDPEFLWRLEQQRRRDEDNDWGSPERPENPETPEDPSSSAGR